MTRLTRKMFILVRSMCFHSVTNLGTEDCEVRSKVTHDDNDKIDQPVDSGKV